MEEIFVTRPVLVLKVALRYSSHTSKSIHRSDRFSSNNLHLYMQFEALNLITDFHKTWTYFFVSSVMRTIFMQPRRNWRTIQLMVTAKTWREPIKENLKFTSTSFWFASIGWYRKYSMHSLSTCRKNSYDYHI